MLYEEEKAEAAAQTRLVGASTDASTADTKPRLAYLGNTHEYVKFRRGFRLLCWLWLSLCIAPMLFLTMAYRTQDKSIYRAALLARARAGGPVTREQCADQVRPVACQCQPARHLRSH